MLGCMGCDFRFLLFYCPGQGQIAYLSLHDVHVCYVTRFCRMIRHRERAAVRSAGNAVDIGAGYLPAGQLVATAAGALTLTADGIAGKAIDVAAGAAITTGAYAFDVGTEGAGASEAYAANAKVYAGPFMEVMMTSSTTKMVVGAVCVNNAFTKTSTVAYMDVASRVVHVSDASVYIEGGFGKLSLSTSKYGGSVGGVSHAS